MNIEVSVLVQAALLPILPLVMLGLRQNIPFVERNRAWFCPLLCIVSAITVAFFMHLPQWFFVGITTGAAVNKIYDWFHDSYKMPQGPSGTSVGMILLLCLFLPLAGCSPKIKVTSEYDSHVRNTQSKVASYYEKCMSGDPNACRACLTLAAAECDYIVDGLNDPNKPVTADKESTDYIKVRQAELEWLEYKCDDRDANACKAGAVGGNRFLIHFLNAVDDVNSTVKF